MSIDAPTGNSFHIPNKSRWAVAVFAHNEANNILQCLNSLRKTSTPQTRMEIHVLNNGSTDNTASLVRNYMHQHPQVHLHEIQLGDKANAWNYFIHHIAPRADCYFFVDGDVQISPGAFLALSSALHANAYAHAATGVPYSGRNRHAQLANLEQEGGLQGNLYALKNEFVETLRERNIRIPTGFIREDGLVGAFAMFNLDPITYRWNKARVIVVMHAGFYFHSLNWWNPHDIRTYWKRRIRYSIGYFQTQLLRDVLLKRGIYAMPRHSSSLYDSPSFPKLKWRGLNTFFDMLALWHIRQHRQEHTRPQRAHI